MINRYGPSFGNVDELLKVKASLSPVKWNAQWQQNPTSEAVAMIKRDWWQTLGEGRYATIRLYSAEL